MSYERLYNLETPQNEPSYLDSFPGRSEVIEEIKKRSNWDVVIVGGGIHGACFARLAAFNGLRTLLLEQNDYAFGTSSRSSKMAHGGLRYLETFDFQQVLEGVKSREELFRIASHLVHPTDFLIPIDEEEKIKKIKMGIGLSLYDLFLKDKSRKHKWISRQELRTEVFNQNTPGLAGCFRYSDGIMNDARLVIETIVSARQEGAQCLNYAKFVSVKQELDQTLTVGWNDVISGESHQLTAGLVVNCAGPWAPMIGRLSASSLSRSLRYSQGSHLLFNRSWKDPALFLPLDDKGRYYFVWPHFAGTLVGTTEREVTTVDADPIPTKDEVEEILARLAKDVPHARLDRSTLHYAFAGVRSLPVREKGASSKTGALSRKHIWSYGQGILTLLGGKFTTARWTALEGLKTAMKLSENKHAVDPMNGRNLPGAWRNPTQRSEIQKKLIDAGVQENLSNILLCRYGAKTAVLLEQPELLNPIGEYLVEGDISIAMKVEQAESVEDVLSRRTGVTYFPGSGQAEIGQISGLMEKTKSTIASERSSSDVANYNEKIRKIQTLLNN